MVVVSNQHYNDGSEGIFWNLLAAGALGLTTAISTTKTATVTSSCEGEQQQQQEADNDDDMKKWEIGPDDPYYNIPDEDEPTDCSMCLTFRQGPCRIDWKRFELCVKDKDKGKGKKSQDNKNHDDATPKKEEEEEDDPAACMKYAMPFYNCSTKHVNTYLIIGTDQTQKTVIEPLMESYGSPEAQSRRLCFLDHNSNNNIQLDWTNWEKFVTALYELGRTLPSKYDLEKTKFRSAADALRATWADDDNNKDTTDGQQQQPKEKGKNQYLMMNDEGEPFLITVTIQIPKTPGPYSAAGGATGPGNKASDDKSDNEDDSSLLFMTFALDQHGNLMGDARNNDDDDNDNNTNKNETKAVATTQELQVQIVPGVTKEFTVYGLYVPKGKDFLTDGMMYESKPYKIDTITKKATKEAKKNKKKQKQNPQEEESQ